MFKNIFFDLCNEKGIKPTPLVEQLGLSKGSVTHWKKGRNPDLDALQKIADYFNVSIDYLVGREKAPDKAEAKVITFDEWENRILEHFRACDLDGKAEILTFALQTREQREKINQRADKIST